MHGPEKAPNFVVYYFGAVSVACIIHTSRSVSIWKLDKNWLILEPFCTAKKCIVITKKAVHS